MLKKIGWLFVALVVLFAVVLAVMFERADLETAVLDDEVRARAPGEFVALSDGVTHYDIAGPEDGRAVVLVHGFSVPFYIWDTTFVALADAGYRVVRYDTFGRGYSDRPDTRYDGALFERQLGDLIEALGLKAPVDIVGLSMGGAVVTRFAANQPDRVRKLVLVDPTYDSWGTPELPRPLAPLVMTLMYFPHAADGQYADFLYPENYPDWAERYRVQMRYEGFRRAIIATLYEFGPDDHLEYYRRLQSLDVPVLLVWGAEDQTIPIAGADTVRGVLDVEYLRVEDAGHLPHIEQADIVNPAIVEFLRSVERGLPASE